MPDQRHPGPPGAPPRRLAVAVALAASMAAGILVGATGPARAAPSTALGPEATRLVELLNGERAARGLPALRVLPRLVQMARAQSAAMGADGAPCQEPYLHHNPDLGNQVQPASAWGENVGCA